MIHSSTVRQKEGLFNALPRLQTYSYSELLLQKKLLATSIIARPKKDKDEMIDPISGRIFNKRQHKYTRSAV